MINKYFPTFANWFRSSKLTFGPRSIGDRQRQGGFIGAAPRWKLGTWWMSDSLESVQQSLLRILAIAQSQRTPPDKLIRNLALEHTWGHRRRLHRLADRIAAGTPLSAALEQTPDCLSDPAVLAIRLGEQSGNLNAVYDDLISSCETVPTESRVLYRHIKLYAIGMTIALAVALSFLLGRMARLFSTIIKEIGVQSEFGYSFQAYAFVGKQNIGYVLLLCLLIVFAIALITSRPARRLYRRSFASKFSHQIAMQRTAELLRLLSLSVSAGRPMSGVISTLAKYHFDATFRQRLLFVRNEIEHGADPWTSLFEAKILPQNEANSLSAALTSRTRAWILHKLSERKDSRYRQRTARLTNLLQLAVILLFALPVLWLSTAIMGFLSRLIVQLS